MGYTDGSRYGDKHSHGALTAQASGWEIKERGGGGPLDEASVRAVMLPREKRKGVWYGDEA